MRRFAVLAAPIAVLATLGTVGVLASAEVVTTTLFVSTTGSDSNPARSQSRA